MKNKIVERVLSTGGKVRITETDKHWILHDVPLLSEFSQNKQNGKSRRYTKEEQEKALKKLPKGDILEIYCNHGERSVENKLGMATNAHVVVKNVDGKPVAETVGDVHLVKGPKGDHIAGLADMDARLAGMSITGDATDGFKESADYAEIQGLELHTVDVVDKPATTRGFQERLEECVSDEAERKALAEQYAKKLEERSQGEDPNQPNQDVPPNQYGPAAKAAGSSDATPSTAPAPDKKSADNKKADKAGTDVKSEPIDSTKWIDDCDKCGGDLVDGKCEDCGHTQESVQEDEDDDDSETPGDQDEDSNPEDSDPADDSLENDPGDPDTNPGGDDANGEADPTGMADGDPVDGADDPAGAVDAQGGGDLEAVRNQANAATTNADSANTSQAHMDACFEHAGAARDFARGGDPNGARLHFEHALRHKERAESLRDQEGDMTQPVQPPINDGGAGGKVTDVANTRESKTPAKPKTYTAEELALLRIPVGSKLAEALVTLPPEAVAELQERLIPVTLPNGARKENPSLFENTVAKPEAKSLVAAAFPKPLT